MGQSLSIYLDGLRFLAAVVVFFAHSSYQRLTGDFLPHFGEVADDAVMAFFVLSGFVIAYTAEKKETELGAYARARLARLWSVVIPALIVTVIADQIGRRANPVIYDGWWYQDAWPVLRLLAAAMFSNELWLLSVRPFSNGPFWSVGYEFWYYTIFAAAFFLRGWRRAAGLTVTALIAGPKILLLFPVWCLGAALWLLRDRIPERAGWSLFLGSLAAYAVWQAVDGRTYTYWRLDILLPFDPGWSGALLSKWIVGGLFACNIAGAIALQRNVSLERVAGLIRWPAGTTFSLYLFHYPLLHCFAAILPDVAVKPMLVIGLTLVTVAALAEVTERKKYVWRRAIDAACSRYPVIRRPPASAESRHMPGPSA